MVTLTPEACAEKYAFLKPVIDPPLPHAIGGDCQPEGCGLNGVWLGRETQFRTLNLPDRDGPGGAQIFPTPPNEAGIQIVNFMAQGQHLDIDVQKQSLIGTPKNSNGAVDLVGAQLLLRKVGVNQPTFTLTIESVDTNKKFWAGCGHDPADSNADQCDEAPNTATEYHFTVTSDEGCRIELCAPGMDDDYHELTGDAVIFRGDHYDDNYQVSPPSDLEFNIACVKTDLYKLHMLRRTVAAQSSKYPLSIEERQTLLRVLTADYCGIGHPFTTNDTPIRFGFANSNYNLTAASQYVIVPQDVVEASWYTNGAYCIDAPRGMHTLDEIKNVCGAAPGPCPSQQPAPAGPLATSAIPNP